MTDETTETTIEYAVRTAHGRLVNYGEGSKGLADALRDYYGNREGALLFRTRTVTVTEWSQTVPLREP